MYGVGIAMLVHVSSCAEEASWIRHWREEPVSRGRGWWSIAERFRWKVGKGIIACARGGGRAPPGGAVAEGERQVMAAAAVIYRSVPVHTRTRRRAPAISSDKRARARARSRLSRRLVARLNKRRDDRFKLEQHRPRRLTARLLFVLSSAAWNRAYPSNLSPLSERNSYPSK